MIRLLFSAVLMVNPLLFATSSTFAQEAVTIVVLGDSLSAGYGLAPGEGFPAQLERALKARGQVVKIIDAGVSGDTSSGGLSRLEWSVPRDADAVIVELGANDALRGVDPAVTKGSIDQIVTRLKARNQAVLLAGMYAPPNMGDHYVSRFNAIFPEIAKRRGVALYPFFLDGVAGDPALNQADGIHPTAEGIAKIVQGMLPALDALISHVRAENG